MPKLQVYDQRPPKELLPKAIPIDMDEWGSSSKNPLATHGALPCMNVVIHREASGVLAHIGQFSTLKGLEYPAIISRVELYHKACFTIRDMLINGLGYTSNFYLWLGAGLAYTPGSRFAKEHDSVLYDLPEYLKRFLTEMGCSNFQIYDFRKMDTKKDYESGDILYDPPTGIIYMLSEREDIYKIQDKSNKPEASGKCY